MGEQVLVVLPLRTLIVGRRKKTDLQPSKEGSRLLYHYSEVLAKAAAAISSPSIVWI